MTRLLSLLFSIILTASFIIPPVIALIEKGNSICHVDFGDEKEKKGNQESEKEKVEIYFTSHNTIGFMSIAFIGANSGEEQGNYNDLSPDIFLPPPELIKYLHI